MAGVSSESLAAALEQLEPRLTTAELPLAEELFVILGLLDGNAGLRRALTDPARDGKDKAALLSRLVTGKVSAAAEATAADLAAARWRSARDIGDALEVLAGTTAVAVAERQGGTAGLDALEEQLFEFCQIVGSSHELQRALDEPQASAESKTSLAFRLVPNAGEAAKLLIRQAVTAPRGLKPAELVNSFIELVAKRQQRWIAHVSVTRPLTAEQSNRLQTGLNNLYGRELNLNVSIEPDLIGGIRVVVGDEILDGSTVSRLSELRRRLAS
ncbi:F0F1 ATP synthase subunit delta [Zhihengliuella halotolerans]|uniref:F0F1 ATP synthase subunit delta n=1 Tax=Zhihengliuella halotolerans TaxID=370736 RepID=UPI000C7FFCB6|nr:F0F1 ATP synthase subunit delta [Zhihengliuella halotolerans]MCO1338152.1 ATP synthase F1 subunit delta [Kocuria polaris]